MDEMEEKISLREARQGFASYVRAAERGDRFVITRRGKPVARLVPIEPAGRVLTPEQQAARERTLERMRRGIDPGGAKLDRGELYDERCGIGRDACARRR